MVTLRYDVITYVDERICCENSDQAGPWASYARRGRGHAQGRPKDRDALGARREALIDPHAGRPPPVQRIRGTWLPQQLANRERVTRYGGLTPDSKSGIRQRRACPGEPGGS